MNVALKEWAAIIRVLEQGRQVVLLRKGGIAEVEGRFEPTYREFLLYPTFEHQDIRLIASEVRPFVRQTEAERKPGIVRISSLAKVENVAQVHSLEEFERLGVEHVFTDAYIEQRLNYKPDLPLYVLLLRVSTLPHPVEIVETPAYAGCRSWVILDEDIPTEGASPVLTDQEFQRRAGLLLPR